MAKTEKITSIELNPRVWYRGKSGVNSALLKSRRRHGYRQQCCIGVACTASGIPDNVIKNHSGIEELIADVSNAPAWFHVMSALNGDHDLYDINDERDSRITDTERVCRLNDELQSRRIPLRFRLKKIGSGTKATKAKRAVSPRRSAAQEKGTH